MTFRRSLDEYKRERETSTPFPGERRTQSGLFSGSGRRLVHVGPSGAVRDYSYPLAGLHGVSLSRFGIRTPERTEWFGDGATHSQTYHSGSALVETVHDLDGVKVEQRDVTLGQSHVTSFEVVGGDSDPAGLVGFVEFSPDGQEGRSGQLIHDTDVVEVYHDREHDYLGVSTELLTVEPTAPERFAETLSSDPRSPPSANTAGDYEGSRLTNGVCFRADLEDGGTTVVSLLTDIEEQSRASSLDAIASRIQGSRTATNVVATARRSYPFSRVTDTPVATDLRVLYVLSAPTGARMAAPEFDPYYQYSGGYGYTWFRDDAEIATFLLAADRTLGLGLRECHRKSARFYLDTQLDDGRWPHRVWPRNGRLAPGWANGHLEGTERDYQADQTASALVFLSEYLATYEESMDDALVHEIGRALDTGVNGLDISMRPDGLPATSENAWENMKGRFTHVAAGFLRAYSSVADGPCAPELRDRASERAHDLYDGIGTMWAPDEEVYAMRLDDGELDTRADSTTLSLVDAHLAYARIGEIGDRRLRRLDAHLRTTFERLWRETAAVRGLKRFEGDTWRRGDQTGEKVWTVSTGWGAYAAERARRLFPPSERETDLACWAARLFTEISPAGSLCLPSGYLPEQFFDSGAPDSATPLGWSHAIRLATYAVRESRTD